MNRWFIALLCLCLPWFSQAAAPAKRALLDIADVQGDVDGFIAQYDPKTRKVPKIAAEIARLRAEAEKIPACVLQSTQCTLPELQALTGQLSTLRARLAPRRSHSG